MVQCRELGDPGDPPERRSAGLQPPDLQPPGTRLGEQDGPDGSLLGVFAQRVTPDGRLVGPRAQVNRYTEHDQGQPAVASDARGNAVVVWSSYGQDGDLGGIFARVFDESLNGQSEEVAVNEEWQGHQSRPQVGVDGTGSFVVAWETELATDVPSKISFRRFSASGLPMGPEISVASEEEASLRLVDLAVDSQGEVTIRWAVRLVTGELLGVLSQRYDGSGRPLGSPERVLP